jgi:O-6-methylguanine DNA methyltransferase
MSEFRSKVLRVVSKIPTGQTLSYKEVAKKTGNSKAYRAVGNILHQNYDPKIPCHRVICSNGKAGGYNRGRKKKINLLKNEEAYKSMHKAV